MSLTLARLTQPVWDGMPIQGCGHGTRKETALIVNTKEGAPKDAFYNTHHMLIG